MWDLVCRCWSTLWDDRPDASLVTNALSDAGDFIEFRRREPGLVAFLDATKAGGKGGLEIKKAQELMDTVDLVCRFREHTSLSDTSDHAHRCLMRETSPSELESSI